MAIKKEASNRRWRSIRNKPETDLALTPETVSTFLVKKESELVEDKIRETMEHLADLRLEKRKFINDDPDAPGDLVICEGLEAFLVPAVEDSLHFSSFLESYDNREEISAAFCKDLEELLTIWEEEGFPGEPYASADRIKKSLSGNVMDKFKKINITESAAMACRVIAHFLTLHLNKQNEEKLFNQLIGAKLKNKIDRLIAVLETAIDFLIDSFQKGDDKTNPIGSAKVNNVEGSGWSWTNWQGLSPMLFFTSVAVDAFAELDLYIIRPGSKKQGHQILIDFYDRNKNKFFDYQFCVDMARRWVINSVLNNITKGLGFHYEPGIDIIEKYQEDEVTKEYYLNDLKQVEGIYKDKKTGEMHKPSVLYNNLYALLILLWSFGDWDDEASGIQYQAKAKIERALIQLVSNYLNVQVFQDILNRYPNFFILPGGDIFDPGAEIDDRIYMDSGFLTLLARLLVLYGVYGVGDRNILEPLIRNLYVDLLLNRYRQEPNYAYLWSKNSKEIFSTFRALQALTFYSAYTKGKELGGGEFMSDYSSFFFTIAKQLAKVKQSAALEIEGESLNNEASKKKELKITFKLFDKYYKDKGKVWTSLPEVEQRIFLKGLKNTGQRILDDYHKNKIRYEDAIVLLDECVKIGSDPIDEKGAPYSDALIEVQSNHKKIIS